MHTNLFSGYGRVIALLITLFVLAGCNGSDSGSGDNNGDVKGGDNSLNNQADAGSGADIEAICALPTLGPAVVSAAGGDCDESDGGAGFDASALCAVPVLGPLLVSGSGGDDCGGDGTSPMDSLSVEELQPLCAIPSLGPIILDSVGGICPGEDASPISTISAGFICSIPELGGPMAMAMGVNCDDTPSSPLNPGLLCMVPLVGQLLVEAGGYECLVPTALSTPQDLACQVAPLQPVIEPVCPLPDPEALCVIPVLGPGLVEPLLGDCPDAGDSVFLPPLEL